MVNPSGNVGAPLSVMLCDGSTGLPWAAPMPTQLLDQNGVAVQFPLAVKESAAPIPYGANVTPIAGNGTNSINAGGGLYYGLMVTGIGTLWVGTVLDIYATGTGTASATNTLAAGITLGALGLAALAGPSGLGIRYKGTLQVVTSGTIAGSLNCLWD